MKESKQKENLLLSHVAFKDENGYKCNLDHYLCLALL